MKSVFNSGTSGTSLSLWLLLLRIGVACLMLIHGWPKFQNVINGEFNFADPIGVGPKISLILTVFAEVFCSVFICIGFATRLSVIPLIINMAVAVFIVHGKDVIAKKELGLLYLFIYLTLAFLGAGRFSVDHAIGGGGRRRR